MPKKEIDYSKCVIYKIQHKDNNDLLYVGHTTNFTKRKYEHKSGVNNEKGNAYNHKVYQMIRENGGWLDFNMVEVKDFPCENNRQATTEEDRIMREMKATLNTIRASHSRKEYRQDNKEQIKEYKQQSYEKNKEQIKERVREYNEKNKEKIQEHKNKVCLCICGKEYTHSHKLRHERTQFHLNFICIDTDLPSSSQPEPASS